VTAAQLLALVTAQIFAAYYLDASGPDKLGGTGRDQPTDPTEEELLKLSIRQAAAIIAATARP